MSDGGVTESNPSIPQTPAQGSVASTGETVRVAERRDRLLAGLTLVATVGLILAMPFALKSGAEFFLPLTVALVIAIALVPILEWLERRRVPSALAAIMCLLLFIAVANVAVAAIVVPATDFFRLLPSRIGRIQSNLQPLIVRERLARGWAHKRSNLSYGTA